MRDGMYICCFYRAYYLHQRKTGRREIDPDADFEFDDVIGHRMNNVQYTETRSTAHKFTPRDMLNKYSIEYLDYLESSNPELTSHEDVICHIQNYIENHTMALSDQCRFKSRQELQLLLNELVFNQEYSSIVARSIPEKILLSQDASYWAIRYLEDCQPSDQDGPYKYNPGLRDEWFQQEIGLPGLDEHGAVGGNGRKKTIKIYNRLMKDLDVSDIETEAGFSYYYHGTVFKDAENILDTGIRLNKGRSRKDFSDGDGFYITRDYYQARDWAQKFWMYPTIIVFKTANEFFSDRTKNIHLTVTDIKTLVIVKHFRSGGRNERNAINEIENPRVYQCDSISGPILYKVPKFYEDEEIFLKDHQICIRSKNCANEFYSHIDRIIFNA